MTLRSAGDADHVAGVDRAVSFEQVKESPASCQGRLIGSGGMV
ncbi:MAG: hypothetical protein OEW13_09965 [Nitrospira sp.]|nr:hypothetical protein [Nitrospira sp.]MDH5348215.1 hypothetical protein [Nitrospira sp.]